MVTLHGCRLQLEECSRLVGGTFCRNQLKLWRKEHNKFQNAHFLPQKSAWVETWEAMDQRIDVCFLHLRCSKSHQERSRDILPKFGATKCLFWQKKNREGISSSINELDGEMLSEYAWNLSHGPDTCDPIFPSVDARPSMSSVFTVLHCIHGRFTDASKSAS